MSTTESESVPSPLPSEPGREERHIARGALLQQVSQLWGTGCMLVVATLLGRTLSLDEFGVYGLLLSLVAYLVTVQVSVEGAAVRALSAAEVGKGHTRGQAFSTTLAIYAVGGLAAAVLVATGGTLLVDVLGIPDALRGAAREAVLGLAVVTALGWPFKVFQDGLRSAQLFGAAAAAEMAAYATVAIGIVVATLLNAPLWALVVIGGSLPALIGLWAAAAMLVTRLGHRFRRDDVDRELAREMLGISAYLFSAGLADLVIYSLDRVVLAAFRGTAAVGLYEGVARPNNLLRQLHGTLVLTVIPVASGYLASGDHDRVRELLVRGTRYVVAIVAPATVVLVVLAAPLLEVWLGDRYRVAAVALAIFSGYWILGANTGVASSLLVAAGEVRFVARFAWGVAISNLALSLILTPLMGLNGVVLGTTIPSAVGVPILLAIVLPRFGVPVRQFAREVWIPAYSVCVPLAAGLAAWRLIDEPDTLPALAAAALSGLALAWGLYWLVWMRPNERRLLRSFVPLVR